MRVSDLDVKAQLFGLPLGDYSLLIANPTLADSGKCQA